MRLELTHADRTLVPVHKEVKQKIKGARQSHEHEWQTIERLLLAGIKASQNGDAA